MEQMESYQLYHSLSQYLLSWQHK